MTKTVQDQIADNFKRLSEIEKKYPTQFLTWRALKKCGCSDASAAGVMGNIQQESNFTYTYDDDYERTIGGTGMYQMTHGRAKAMKEWCKKHYGKWQNPEAQTMWFFQSGDIKTCFINYTGKTYTYGNGTVTWWPTKMTEDEFKKLKDISTATQVFCRVVERPSIPMMDKRIAYAKNWYSIFTGLVPTGSSAAPEEGGFLLAHVEKLFSSDNYAYIKQKKKTEPGPLDKLAEQIAKGSERIIKYLETGDESVITEGVSIHNVINDSLLKVLDKILDKYDKHVFLPTTVVEKEIFGHNLPVISTEVEAPYVEIAIKGIVFGGYKAGKYPNYVKSLDIVKTNGSINEYTINLIHQIRPGDNPNYIDNALSSIKYNEIQIIYGNANTGAIFNDSKAMITNITTKFDFTNCNINYIISATSLSALSASEKYTYPEVTDKPSNIIRNQLYGEDNSPLLQAFPGMKNQAEMEKEGFLPTTDKEVTIEKVENITPVAYLNKLVDAMENKVKTAEDKIRTSLYLLATKDTAEGATFEVKEVKTSQVVSNVPFVYEATVGYPDDNFIFDFKVETDFSWASTYKSNLGLEQYNYDIDFNGDIKKNTKISSYGQEMSGNNLWEDLTKFPIMAKLNIRGLLQASLLLQYIKINVVMFGRKRISSGIYIVTEQRDQLGGGGFTTELSLLRVAGDNQFINVDGRVVT